jgi:hypothetical protein
MSSDLGFCNFFSLRGAQLCAVVIFLCRPTSLLPSPFHGHVNKVREVEGQQDPNEKLCFFDIKQFGT